MTVTTPYFQAIKTCLISLHILLTVYLFCIFFSFFLQKEALEITVVEGKCLEEKDCFLSCIYRSFFRLFIIVLPFLLLIIIIIIIMDIYISLLYGLFVAMYF